LIYKCGGIDKRTIEKFEKVRYILSCYSSSSLISVIVNSRLIAKFCPSVGQNPSLARQLQIFAPGRFVTAT
jgi:hypothetical protein